MPFPPLFLLNVYQFCACVLKKYIDFFCRIKKNVYICNIDRSIKKINCLTKKINWL